MACETFGFKKSLVINEDITTDKFKKILKKEIKNTEIEGVIAGYHVKVFLVAELKINFQWQKIKEIIFIKIFEVEYN